MGKKLHRGFDEGEAEFQVANAEPQIASIGGSTDPVALGTAVSITADFTDVGSMGFYECRFTWDDGQTTTFTAAGVGDGSCSAPHVYSALGVYGVEVEVTDDDTGEVTEAFEFVVYDASGSFVTGGDWIDSPAGASVADSSLTGKASLSFISKYKEGAAVPTGRIQF